MHARSSALSKHRQAARQAGRRHTSHASFLGSFRLLKFHIEIPCCHSASPALSLSRHPATKPGGVRQPGAHMHREDDRKRVREGRGGGREKQTFPKTTRPFMCGMKVSFRWRACVLRVIAPHLSPHSFLIVIIFDGVPL